jgi:hypothetical protein
MSKEPLGYGSAQNFQDSDLAQYYKKDNLLSELQILKDEQKRLSNSLHVPGAEDQELGAAFDAVTKEIAALEKRIQNEYGAEGGRRKRRTHRRSKSRRSKSCAKKSRRSKH